MIMLNPMHPFVRLMYVVLMLILIFFLIFFDDLLDDHNQVDNIFVEDIQKDLLLLV